MTPSHELGEVQERRLEEADDLLLKRNCYGKGTEVFTLAWEAASCCQSRGLPVPALPRAGTVGHISDGETGRQHRSSAGTGEQPLCPQLWGSGDTF